MSGTQDAQDAKDSGRHKTPYGEKHPIPTISHYREERAARQEEALNKTTEQTNIKNQQVNQHSIDDDDYDDDDNEKSQTPKDTSEIDPSAMDARQRRKDNRSKRTAKENAKERAERVVTDPVTHLPVTIHDFTDSMLKNVDLYETSPTSLLKRGTGLSQMDTHEQLESEQRHIQSSHSSFVNCFPPPDFDSLRHHFSISIGRTISYGLVGVVAILVITVVTSTLTQRYWPFNYLLQIIVAVTAAGTCWVLLLGVREYTTSRINSLFEDELWDSQRRKISQNAEKHEKETTAWLNSLLGSVWPLVDPDLFTSLGDTLEDVMQASLPKLVRMVSVEDIGQGSESVQILGVRWLPRGAATKSVADHGDLQQDKGKASKESEEESDKNQNEELLQGMEAEEGEFINLEVAFAYRTWTKSKSFRQRSKDMHLCLAFYLPGNVKVPVWVDLQGIIGTMRIRLQLTPDPPFFALATMTFLGQPKVDLSCVPLNKHALNIMDVPFISNFVQSAVDAAMAEYVAPKSLTLDLQSMLSSDDFKKDTHAKGVLMVHIHRGYDFKMGDTTIPLIKDGKSDPYVSVGWAKFGKVIWSTRIMTSEMEPCWEETCFILVTPDELNVEERLRIQLWDSDRMSADDDLGRIEVDLKELLTSRESNGKMWHRIDEFRALRTGENVPGKLEWRVGYFSKVRIQPDQFRKQTYDSNIRSMSDLKEKVSSRCERKLREAMIKGRNERNESEMQQQKAQDLKVEQDNFILSAPPPDRYPSGILSLQIHNITGLEIGTLSKDTKGIDADESDQETGEGLPSAYCTIIINHKKVYKTRTKPQSSKPFYNAGCEKFIRDWRDCEVFISVRDSRIDEDNALIGIVQLCLDELFQERSQVTSTWPLAGGIGHGKMKVSMVWRSVQLQAPSQLLGWDYGTVEIQPQVEATGLSNEALSSKLKFKTNIGSGKMYRRDGGWSTKGEQSLVLAAHKRYSSCMSIAFKSKSKLGDDVVAFCVLWLKDLVDEEEMEINLPVWKGNFERATSNCLEHSGEQIGELKLKVRFWAGLGISHSSWAHKDVNMRDVVEVINSAQENGDMEKAERKTGIVDEEISSESDDGSDDEKGIPDGSMHHKQGPIDKVKDYKRREEGLHRRHKGIMQWKIPRTAKWVKHKLEGVGDKAAGVFDRKTGQAGIETEV